MIAEAQKLSLLDVPAYSPTEVGQIATVLLEKMNTRGWEKMSVDEQVELRLLRMLFE